MCKCFDLPEHRHCPNPYCDDDGQYFEGDPRGGFWEVQCEWCHIVQDSFYNTIDGMACPRCERKTDDVLKRRCNTNYANDEDNFTLLCRECFDEEELHWADMWEDYYGGRL